MIKGQVLSLVLFLSLALFACTPDVGFELHEQTIYYVATTGNDSNSCTAPDVPCLTVRAAVEKSNADDRIIIAAGTYNETSIYSSGAAFRIEESLFIEGAGRGVTIIDTGGDFGGFAITGAGSVSLEGFTIRNSGGEAPGSCINIRDEAVVTIENVEATQCFPTGINNSSSGLVTLTDVSISQAIAEATEGGGLVHGIGIANFGEMVIDDSTIGGNGAQGISSNGTLTISDTQIQNNNREGILHFGGELQLNMVVISNNGLDGSYVPGLHIENGASATVSTSVFSGNPEGIHMDDPASLLIMENSTVSSNSLTGIFIDLGEAQLTNVVVSENGTTGAGSGIVSGITNQGTMLIQDSRITQNLNGGVMNDEDGEITIYQTTIDQNHGGAVALMNLGSANIQNSLIANNVVDELDVSYAAVENRGSMTLANSTVSGNSHTGIGAGSGSLFLSYVTVAENGDTGIAAHQSGALIHQMHNVIVGKNGVRDCNFSSAFPFPTSTGVNIATDATCGFAVQVSAAELLLDALLDNGGPTFTHALLPDSPALDAATGACIEVDQRLFPRPFGPACDVGAYEFTGSASSLEGFIFPTQTSDSPFLTVDIDFPCYAGPGPQYNTLSTLAAGTQLQIVGYGFGGGWLVAFHPNNQGQHCWIDEDFVTVPIPLDQLRLISIPPKPTSTPTPEGEPREPDAEPTVCVTVPPNNFTVCQ